MTVSAAANAEPEETEDEVDLDLDLEDANLREAIGKPTRIRLGGRVLTFPHHAEWTHEQTRMMTMGMFDSWAQSLLSEVDWKAWQAAGLRNYQFDAIVKEMLNRMGAPSQGKSRPPSRSPQRRRRN